MVGGIAETSGRCKGKRSVRLLNRELVKEEFSFDGIVQERTGSCESQCLTSVP